jgi:hypothetical protein
MFASGLMAMAHPLIGHYISGQVFKGSWNKTKVALKVLTAEDGVTPSSTVCQELSFRLIPVIFTSDCAVDS